MYTSLRMNCLQRSILFDHRKTFVYRVPKRQLTHKERVVKELRALGVTELALLRMESRYLPKIIHPEEHIMAVVYGRHIEGRAMLIATDLRAIFLDKKPLFVKQDEVTYDVVSGVAYSAAGFGVSVTLHTKVKDYAIRTLNRKCAAGFVAYIESRRLERMRGDPIL